MICLPYKNVFVVLPFLHDYNWDLSLLFNLYLSKTYNFGETVDSGQIMDQLNSIKENQEKHTAMLASLSEQNNKIVGFLAETNILLKRNLGLISSKFDRIFPIKDAKGLEDIENELNAENKQEIVRLKKNHVL